MIRNLTRSKPGRLAFYLLLVGLAYGASGWVFPHLCIAKGDSVKPYLLWLELENPKAYQAGDYVLFPLSYERFQGGKPFLAVKRLACMPGEELLAWRGEAWCNHKPLGLGQRPAAGDPKFSFKGPVPAGKAFVMGDNERSWDSRHWGFLDLSKIEARGHALF
ncbi:MAG: hypothetical protein A2557_11800 [Candidatus Lambdaproteobacteria bacterium RIFOXYD2_FULL_56_26]|uniref:Peptidase S26 domain-containing protein n=1 Tax=Candidatus Lambdaproteobacteria bacterium RIFOXYD2_FULL_56_26 TaxID=1817773 RepID=A0A1F6GUL2_9PROT|nr:MAG: hypothetical protein A2557_11800 [Candidatus Lambdaproteobacteria bacterium RIFOXYD2_FULL_56_26]